MSCCDCGGGWNYGREALKKIERIEAALIKAGLMGPPPPTGITDTATAYRSLKAALDKAVSDMINEPSPAAQLFMKKRRK